MKPDDSEKQIAKFLKSKFDPEVRISAYHDEYKSRQIAIGSFSHGKETFYSTIGAYKLKLKIPAGDFEFATIGKEQWRPNALASSVYWLWQRDIQTWPVVCEDVIKINTQSKYRHMAFLPAEFILPLKNGLKIQWLLGIPLSDKDISAPKKAVHDKIRDIFPDWLFYS